jgi:hypothetical protein
VCVFVCVWYVWVWVWVDGCEGDRFANNYLFVFIRTGDCDVVCEYGKDPGSAGTGDLSAQPTDAKGDVDPAVDDLTGRLIPPHTNMYVSSYYSLCFLILLHLCFRLRRKQRRQ